jgi:tetratricopeptide (TPR) repeat protein
MQRDHLFDMIRNISTQLMKDVSLPALQRQASDQRMGRQVPTEALTYYSRGLLYSDRGDKTKAAEMFQHAIDIFPNYAEAQESLQRVKAS